MKKKPAFKPKTFAFDFDGVVSIYDGVFKGDEHVGPPRPEVVKAIKRLKKLGHTTLIYSTRSTAVLQKYCRKHHIPVDYINHNPKFKTGNPGKPIAHVYVDDRGYRYRGQSAGVLVRGLVSFKVYKGRHKA